jgi:hypothetical protein
MSYSAADLHDDLERYLGTHGFDIVEDDGQGWIWSFRVLGVSSAALFDTPGEAMMDCLTNFHAEELGD